eukprot:TRINITY_DN3291_c0_g1_i3.p1 TRINITY_DN3291_c0_g1~~TRINITY_DN3291_c0_g1_i3.p1  ORF type:complete len:132 (-),score=8.67 TRINITY_DN3291_c0_g1_i3:14-409(-)
MIVLSTVRDPEVNIVTENVSSFVHKRYPDWLPIDKGGAVYCAAQEIDVHLLYTPGAPKCLQGQPNEVPEALPVSEHAPWGLAFGCVIDISVQIRKHSHTLSLNNGKLALYHFLQNLDLYFKQLKHKEQTCK